MSNIEHNLTTELNGALEKELATPSPLRSLRESLAAVEKASPKREVFTAKHVPTFLEQYAKMEQLNDVLNEQVRMKLVELDHSFRKRMMEAAIAHDRAMSEMIAAHKAEIDDLENLLKKLR